MARLNRTKMNRAIKRAKKIAEAFEADDSVPEFKVTVNEVSSILTTIQVRDLDSGIAATTTCGPKSDIDSIVNGLKNQLIHRTA